MSTNRNIEQSTRDNIYLSTQAMANKHAYRNLKFYDIYKSHYVYVDKDGKFWTAHDETLHVSEDYSNLQILIDNLESHKYEDLDVIELDWSNTPSKTKPASVFRTRYGSGWSVNIINKDGNYQYTDIDDLWVYTEQAFTQLLDINQRKLALMDELNEVKSKMTPLVVHLDLVNKGKEAE